MITTGPAHDHTAPPHRPGSGTTPDTHHLQPLIAALPSRIDATNWQTVALYAEGFRLARAHYSWEAHEAWEAVWHRTAPQSRGYHLLRGLIQIANAELKLAMQQPNAAARLSVMAENHLAEAAANMMPIMGMIPEHLVTNVRVWAQVALAQQRPNDGSHLAHQGLRTCAPHLTHQGPHLDTPGKHLRFPWFDKLHYNAC